MIVVPLHPGARPIHQAEQGRRRGASLIHELAENGNRSPIVPRSIGGDGPRDGIGLALKRVYLIDTGQQQEERDAAKLPHSDFHRVALRSMAAVGILILQSLLRRGRTDGGVATTPVFKSQDSHVDCANSHVSE